MVRYAFGRTYRDPTIKKRNTKRPKGDYAAGANFNRLGWRARASWVTVLWTLRAVTAESKGDCLMRQHVIDQLQREGLAGGWAPRVGERAGYKCEYCDKNLLASVDDYISWQHDHIIPQCADGEDTLENLALSCSICNTQLKKKWNPANVAGKDASREELIQAVRQYVREARSGWAENLSRFRKIVGWEPKRD